MDYELFLVVFVLKFFSSSLVIMSCFSLRNPIFDHGVKHHGNQTQFLRSPFQREIIMTNIGGAGDRAIRLLNEMD